MKSVSGASVDRHGRTVTSFCKSAALQDSTPHHADSAIPGPECRLATRRGAALCRAGHMISRRPRIAPEVNIRTISRTRNCSSPSRRNTERPSCAPISVTGSAIAIRTSVSEV